LQAYGSTKARHVFDCLERKDEITWNIMINGYGIDGNEQEAMNLFHDMQEKGFKPQDVTLVNILSAGSHSQLYEQVLAIFASIQQSYGIEPIHWQDQE
jgi:pentatricopeptide repeat protein